MPCLTENELIELAIRRTDSEKLSEPSCDHLRTCLRCSQGLVEYRDVLSLFSTALQSQPLIPSQRPCLDDEEISAFVDGRISHEKRENVERHLVHCTSCFGQVLDLMKLLEQVDATRSPLLTYIIGLAQNGLSLIKRPVQGFNAQRLEPALLLGSATEHQESRQILSWNQEYEKYQLVFKVTQADDSHVDIKMGIYCHGEPVRDGRVSVRQQSSVVQSEGISAQGEVALRNLEAGMYTLEIKPAPTLGDSFLCDLALCNLHEEK